MRNPANWIIGLVIGGAALVAVAALELFGPVTTFFGECGSVAAPGNSDEMHTAQACDAARSDRANVVLLTGSLGVVSLVGALALRQSRPREQSKGTPG